MTVDVGYPWTTMNSTICPDFKHDDPLCFLPAKHPLYYSSKPRLIDSVADPILTMAAPVIAYWALSLFFHYLDTSEWKWLEKHRIHDSAEVKAKNLVSRSEVVWAVILQQFIQTGLGLLVLPGESAHSVVDHSEQLRQLATHIEPLVSVVVRGSLTPLTLHTTEFLYWWGIPTVQLLGAMYVVFIFALLLANV